MTLLRLSKPWGPHKAGATLAVLAPGEEPRPGAVDPARARALVAGQFAVDAARPETKPATVKEA